MKNTTLFIGALIICTTTMAQAPQLNKGADTFITHSQVKDTTHHKKTHPSKRSHKTVVKQSKKNVGSRQNTSDSTHHLDKY